MLKQYISKSYYHQIDKAAEIERYRGLAEKIRPLVVESVSYLHTRYASFSSS